MTRIVFACADCGAEAPGISVPCSCGGPIERVDPVLVMIADLLTDVLSERAASGSSAEQDQ
jgi:hypothetical protein